MDNPVDIANIFYLIMSAITPIAVAVLGYLQNKKLKNDAAYRKLREEKEQLEQQQKKEVDERNNKKLNTLETSIFKLTNDVKDLKEDVDIQRIEQQLTQLHTLSEFNFEYIQSLSSIVLVMGETISSSDMLDNESKTRLQHEVDAHKKKEIEMASDLHKLIT